MVNKIKTLLNEGKTLIQTDHFLQLLLIADLFYIVVSILHLLPFVKAAIPAFEDNALSISVDRGIGEGFRYVEELWIALALITAMVKRRNWAYLGWALWFFYFLLDDMLQIHETLGELVANLLSNFVSIPASFQNLRLQDLGELTVALTLGIVFVSTIAFTYLRAKQNTRKEFNVLLLMLATFFVFAAGVDFMDRLFNARIIRESLKLVEDGGQLLVMSFMVWYTDSLAKINGQVKNSSSV